MHAGATSNTAIAERLNWSMPSPTWFGCRALSLTITVDGRHRRVVLGLQEKYQAAKRAGAVLI